MASPWQHIVACAGAHAGPPTHGVAGGPRPHPAAASPPTATRDPWPTLAHGHTRQRATIARQPRAGFNAGCHRPRARAGAPAGAPRGGGAWRARGGRERVLSDQRRRAGRAVCHPRRRRRGSGAVSKGAARARRGRARRGYSSCGVVTAPRRRCDAASSPCHDDVRSVANVASP